MTQKHMWFVGQNPRHRPRKVLSCDTTPFSIQSWGQFHQHFTRAFFVWKFIQSQTLSRKKLLKGLSYEKCMHKMLTKLTPALFQAVAYKDFKMHAKNLYSTKRVGRINFSTRPPSRKQFYVHKIKLKPEVNNQVPLC